MYNNNSLDSNKFFYKNFNDLQKLEYRSYYKRWKHLLQLINKYLFTFKNSIIQKLVIKENSTAFLEHQVIKDEIFLTQIKDIFKNGQKKFIEKINNKMMFIQNNNILVIPCYNWPWKSLKYVDVLVFDEDIKDLKKLEDDLYKILIKIIDSLPKGEIYKRLRRTFLKDIPFFFMYIRYIPEDINRKLDQLPEPILHDLANSLIDRLNDYLLQHEKICNYQYFVEEIRDNGLLKGRSI